jgi:hypothetical protein
MKRISAMATDKFTAYDPWPDLPYQDFKSTQHLLHMGVQAIGKLKLTTPFEPHWANVALWLLEKMQGISDAMRWMLRK